MLYRRPSGAGRRPAAEVDQHGREPAVAVRPAVRSPGPPSSGAPRRPAGSRPAFSSRCSQVVRTRWRNVFGSGPAPASTVSGACWRPTRPISTEPRRRSSPGNAPSDPRPAGDVDEGRVAELQLAPVDHARGPRRPPSRRIAPARVAISSARNSDRLRGWTARSDQRRRPACDCQIDVARPRRGSIGRCPAAGPGRSLLFGIGDRVIPAGRSCRARRTG